MSLHKLLVVDSSVAVKWLSTHDERYLDRADRLLKAAEEEETILLMPELAKYEVCNTLLKKKFSVEGALDMIETFYEIGIHFVVMSKEQAAETFEIANAKGMTFYDASFVTLAITNKATLVTDNAKHQGKKIKGLKVIPLKDY